MADSDLDPEFTVENVVAEGIAFTITGDLVTATATASATSVNSYEQAWFDAFSVAQTEANTLAQTNANVIDETLTIVKNEISLVGPRGPSGLIGASGLRGLIGEIGASGLIGEIGASGLRGLIGEIGATGLRGLIGEIGATGLRGLIGATGASGLAPNLTLYPTLAGDNTFTGSNTFDLMYQSIGTTTGSSNAYTCDYASGGSVFYIPTSTANFSVNITNFPTTYTTAPYCIGLIIPDGLYFCRANTGSGSLFQLNGVTKPVYFNGGATSVQTLVSAATIPSTIIQQFIIYATNGTSLNAVLSTVNVLYA